MLERWQVSLSFLCQNILTVIHNFAHSLTLYLAAIRFFVYPSSLPTIWETKIWIKVTLLQIVYKVQNLPFGLDTIAVSTFTLGQGEGAHIAVCSSYSSHVNTRMSPSQVRIFSHGHQFDVHHCDSNVQRWNCGSQYQLIQFRLQMQHSCKNSKWRSCANP